MFDFSLSLRLIIFSLHFYTLFCLLAMESIRTRYKLVSYSGAVKKSLLNDQFSVPIEVESLLINEHAWTFSH